MKESYYFSHDYNARSDAKIKRLLFKHGISGYGIYWAIIEDLYSNNNEIPEDYDVISYDLRTNPDVIISIIKDFELFTVSNGVISSDSVERRLEYRKQSSKIG